LRQGWDPAEFVGFRMQVHYPIWKGTYCLRLDSSAMPHPLPEQRGVEPALRIV